jgi:Zn-dependent protease with chaperone function
MRHPVSTSHLVLGLVFLGIAASWALREGEVVGMDGGRWLLPVILMVAGVAGVVASLARSATRRGRQDHAEPFPGGEELPGSEEAHEPLR